MNDPMIIQTITFLLDGWNILFNIANSFLSRLSKGKGSMSTLGFEYEVCDFVATTPLLHSRASQNNATTSCSYLSNLPRGSEEGEGCIWIESFATGNRGSE